MSFHQALRKDAHQPAADGFHTTQNKNFYHGLEYAEYAIMPGVITSFIVFIRHLFSLRFPFLFFLDAFWKSLRYVFALKNVWKSDKPTWAKVFITTVRTSTLAFILSAIASAIKPLGALIAKGVGAVIAGSVGPFFFTLAMSIFTVVSSWDLWNKWRDLRNHPWKETEVEKRKLRNKVMKTLVLATITAAIWPMFKFGLVPVMIGVKVAFLVSNPIGWALAGVISLAVISLAIYKAYSRYKMHQHMRHTARNIVDAGRDPEAELDIDINDLRAKAQIDLEIEFYKKNRKSYGLEGLPEAQANLTKEQQKSIYKQFIKGQLALLQQQDEADKKYVNELDKHIHKGGWFQRLRIFFGARSPLERETAMKIHEAVQVKFKTKTEAFLPNDLVDKVNQVKEYAYGFFPKNLAEGSNPLWREVKDAEKLTRAYEDYLRYGTTRYHVCMESRRPQEQQLGFFNLDIDKKLKEKKSGFENSPEFQKLANLNQSREILHYDYERDYYVKAKKIHEIARNSDFDPYETLGVPLDAGQWRIWRGYKAKLKEIEKSRASTEEKEKQKLPIKKAYYCLGEKGHHKYFDLVYAAHHETSHNLYKIVSGDTQQIDDPKMLYEAYKRTKQNISGATKEIQERKLAKLKWAYQLLKNTACRSRYNNLCTSASHYYEEIKKEETANKPVNYYAILGIEAATVKDVNSENQANRNAAIQIIQEAYKKKISEFRLPNDENLDAEQQYTTDRKLIEDAYAILTNPNKKGQYDEKLASLAQAQEEQRHREEEERQRLEQEQKQAQERIQEQERQQQRQKEEKRRLKEERRRQEQENQRLEQERRKLEEEKRRLEEEQERRKLEQERQRLEEEKRRQEQEKQRLEEERRKLEEERRKLEEDRRKLEEEQRRRLEEEKKRGSLEQQRVKSSEEQWVAQKEEMKLHQKPEIESSSSFYKVAESPTSEETSSPPQDPQNKSQTQDKQKTQSPPTHH